VPTRNGYVFIDREGTLRTDHVLRLRVTKFHLDEKIASREPAAEAISRGP
jgi:hypothetical protein